MTYVSAFKISITVSHWSHFNQEKANATLIVPSKALKALELKVKASLSCGVSRVFNQLQLAVSREKAASGLSLHGFEVLPGIAC